ncbi:hypothetical protein QQ008_04135 [Fulvivirgaceae bacterium BMA10]|uniref:Small multi-drug export protein n=1 Tax=Splendidivirga corallicola TaxID=3051826 RepID=A0ABT8KIH0_9BACT|nr:hypothetical protein [Fulvivirgaceae bacterium BMA10]
MAELVKYLTIYFFTMVKFIAGPTMGTVSGLSWIETVLITVAGMMTSVIIFAYLGEKFRKKYLSRIFKKKKKFSKKNRNFVIIWKKWGVFGVTFLTPIIFTPIGGTLLITSMGESKKKFIPYMLFSAIFWSLSFSTFFHFFVSKINL